MDNRTKRKISLLSEGTVSLPGFYMAGPILTPFLEEASIVRQLVENGYSVKIYNDDCSESQLLTLDNYITLIDTYKLTVDGVATSNADGMMSYEDKCKLDQISAQADDVECTAYYQTGIRLASISVNGVDQDIYAPITSADGSSIVTVKGDDGFSPVASVQQTSTGATITITDADGTTTANITNGTNGTSPTAVVQQTSTGATITITDVNGTTTANITNGTNTSSSASSVNEVYIGNDEPTDPNVKIWIKPSEMSSTNPYVKQSEVETIVQNMIGGALDELY